MNRLLTRALPALAALALAASPALAQTAETAPAAGTPFRAEGVELTLPQGFSEMGELPGGDASEKRYASMRADSTIVLLTVFRSPMLRASGGWQLVGEGFMGGLLGGGMELVEQAPLRVEGADGYVFRVTQPGTDRPVRMFGRFLGFRGRPLAASVTVIGQPADPSADAEIQAMVQSLRPAAAP